MTAEYPLTSALFSPNPQPGLIDAIARRALQILDVLHRSEDGHVVLPDYGGTDVEVRHEVETNARAAELLVKVRFAEFVPRGVAGRRIKLAGVVSKEGESE